MKLFPLIWALLILISTLGACKTSSDSSAKKLQLTPAQFEQELLNDSSIILIDVRPIQGRIQLSIKNAILVPNREALDSLASQLPLNKHILIYCDMGVRSKNMLNHLLSKGFTNVFDLEGGFTAWKNAKMPIEKRENP